MIKVIEKRETNNALSADEVIAANLAMVADGLATLRQFFQPDSEAVSYTHLDVYKRKRYRSRDRECPFPKMLIINCRYCVFPAPLGPYNIKHFLYREPFTQLKTAPANSRSNVFVSLSTSDVSMAYSVVHKQSR